MGASTIRPLEENMAKARDLAGRGQRGVFDRVRAALGQAS
jgi:hypothetical protein